MRDLVDAARLARVLDALAPLGNCTLHSEMVAFMLAQARLGTFTCGGRGRPAYELSTSCDPCAMSLGATLWSGVKLVRCGATRDDALLLRFDEGPVFASSWAYLRRRGLDVRHGVLRGGAVAVFDLYRERGGAIYNG